MARLGQADVEQHAVAGNFSFTGARIANLGATEYTLVNVNVDVTGSVEPFVGDLERMLETVIDACRKSPRSDNLLIRVAKFNSVVGVQEIHGFVSLNDIDASAYKGLHPAGMTPLYDACYVGVSAVNAYAKMMADNDFTANAIDFTITDGDDNYSTATPTMVKNEVAKAVTSEALESHVSILIGINAAEHIAKLQRFQQEAGITQFIDAGEATKGKLAKLAEFVSNSISSTSQALGTGGPSQNIAPTI